MTTEAPASLQRRGIRRAVHDRPADMHPGIPAGLLWQHFAPELRERFLREKGDAGAAEGGG